MSGEHAPPDTDTALELTGGPPLLPDDPDPAPVRGVTARDEDGAQDVTDDPASFDADSTDW